MSRYSQPKRRDLDMMDLEENFFSLQSGQEDRAPLPNYPKSPFRPQMDHWQLKELPQDHQVYASGIRFGLEVLLGNISSPRAWTFLEEHDTTATIIAELVSGIAYNQENNQILDSKGNLKMIQLTDKIYGFMKTSSPLQPDIAHIFLKPNVLVENSDVKHIQTIHPRYTIARERKWANYFKVLQSLHYGLSHTVQPLDLKKGELWPLQNTDTPGILECRCIAMLMELILKKGKMISNISHWLQRLSPYKHMMMNELLLLFERFTHPRPPSHANKNLPKIPADVLAKSTPMAMVGVAASVATSGGSASSGGSSP